MSPPIAQLLRQRATPGFRKLTPFVSTCSASAQAYGNEKEVGDGIKDSGIDRKDLWLTTKVDNHRGKDVQQSVDESLEKLQTDYVDLLLMHWPIALNKENQKEVYSDHTFVDTWKAMEAVYEKGQAKAIGVSNFGIKNLETLLKSAKVTPAVNQIELHPNCPSTKLVEFCQSKGIHVTAYSCLGSTDSPLAKDKTLKAIADKHGKTNQQIMLVWGLKRETSVIPKSVTASRIEANFDLNDIDLSDEEMKQLNSLPDRFKVCDEWLPEKIFGQDYSGTEERF